MSSTCNTEVFYKPSNSHLHWEMFTSKPIRNLRQLKKRFTACVDLAHEPAMNITNMINFQLFVIARGSRAEGVIKRPDLLTYRFTLSCSEQELGIKFSLNSWIHGSFFYIRMTWWLFGGVKVSKTWRFNDCLGCSDEAFISKYCNYCCFKFKIVWKQH